MKTILMIDDDFVELNMLKIVLRDAGYKVLVAEDGAIGIQRALFAQPDLILLDAVMPGLNGYETCAKLKANIRTQHIPVILKTCLHNGESIVAGFRAGVDDFVKKPCNHGNLLARIKLQLSVRSDAARLQFRALAI